MITIVSEELTDSTSLENSLPSSGMSPRIGTPVLFRELALLISPPMNRWGDFEYDARLQELDGFGRHQIDGRGDFETGAVADHRLRLLVLQCEQLGRRERAHAPLGRQCAEKRLRVLVQYTEKKALLRRGGVAGCKPRGADAAASTGGRAEQALPVDAELFGVVQRNFEDLRLDHDLFGLDVEFLDQPADAPRESRQILDHDQVPSDERSDLAVTRNILAYDVRHLLGVGVLHLERLYLRVCTGVIEARFLAEDEVVATAHLDPVTGRLGHAEDRLLDRYVIEIDGHRAGHALAEDDVDPLFSGQHFENMFDGRRTKIEVDPVLARRRAGRRGRLCAVQRRRCRQGAGHHDRDQRLEPFHGLSLVPSRVPPPGGMPSLSWGAGCAGPRIAAASLSCPVSGVCAASLRIDTTNRALFFSNTAPLSCTSTRR